MTISTQASTTTVLGDGSNTSFDFNFIADAAEFISVTFIDTDGTETTLSSSSYTLVINAPATGQLWGVGGTVTYPLVGSPIALGTSLRISRILPYTQVISISNQGDFAPQVIEEMGDTLEMQIQQLAARTTQFRGIWITDTDYTVGDIVQDGANGLNTANYYICTIANTSDVWADDLAAGYWAISVTASVPTGNISLIGDVTGSSALGDPTTTTIGSSKVTTTTIADLAVTTDKLGSSAVTTAKIADANVTLAKIANSSAASKLLGSGTSVIMSSYTEISLGTNLSMSGTTLNAATITLGTPQATTSGTSIIFTSISSTAKRITVNFTGVSTSGTSNILIQIGDLDGFETSGYVSGCFGNVNTTATSTAGFVIVSGGAVAANNYSGSYILSLENSTNFTWCLTGTNTRNDGAVYFSGGTKATSAVTDRVRLTTVNGIDTFDAGEANIMYE